MLVKFQTCHDHGHVTSNHICATETLLLLYLYNVIQRKKISFSFKKNGDFLFLDYKCH